MKIYQLKYWILFFFVCGIFSNVYGDFLFSNLTNQDILKKCYALKDRDNVAFGKAINECLSDQQSKNFTKEQISELKYLLAYQLFLDGKQLKAISKAYEAREVINQEIDSPILFEICLLLGDIYFDQGDFKNVLNVFNNVMHSYSGKNSQRYFAAVDIFLMRIDIKNGAIQDATKLALKLDQYEFIKEDSKLLTPFLLAKTELAMDQLKFDEARKWLKQLQSDTDHGSEKMTTIDGIVALYLSSIELLDTSNTKNETIFNNAVDINAQLHNTSNWVLSAINQGKYYISSLQIEKAEEIIKTIKKVDIELTYNLQLSLLGYYEALHKVGRSYLSLEDIKVKKDSISNLYQRYRLDSELNLLDMRKNYLELSQRYETEQKIYNYKYWLSIALTAFSLLTVFFIFRLVETKRKLTLLNNELKEINDEITENSEKLTTVNSNIKSKLDFIEERKKELEDLCRNYDSLQENSEKLLSQISNLPQSKIHPNLPKKINKIKVSNNFWSSISEPNLRFYNASLVESLIKLHDNLTNQEIKLCCLFQANLSNSEIAAILEKSNDSVKVARSRIWKRLELESIDQLSDYLEGLASDQSNISFIDG